MNRLEWSSPGAGDSRDILVEERLKPVRWWWPGWWLQGRFGVSVLVAVLFFGIGWFLWSGLDDRGSVVRRVGAGSAGPGGIHLEYGRDLSAVEYAAAEVYGAPLYLGKGGRPVVRFEDNGVVRELSELELGWEVAGEYAWTGHGHTVWSPGPGGNGLWWEVNEELETLDPVARFPREKWREMQRSELSAVVRRVELVVRYLAGLELSRWRPGSGQVLLDAVQDLKDRYPPVEFGHWEAVPLLWACDGQIENEFTMGVTSGCPGQVYLEPLTLAWGAVGGVLDAAHRIGEVGVGMDRMESEELASSGLVARQGYLIMDLLRAVELLEARLAVLAQESVRHNLPIVVEVFGEY